MLAQLALAVTVTHTVHFPLPDQYSPYTVRSA